MRPAGLHIVPLAERDVEPCATIMAESGLWARYSIDLGAARTLWRDAFTTGAVVFVARRGAATCGFAWYIPRGAFGLSGYLKLLGVRSESRGAGIGSALLQHVEDRARADGQRDMMLLVSAFNHQAQRFYEAHGYRHVGTIPAYVCPGIDELIFVKRLSEERS